MIAPANMAEDDFRRGEAAAKLNRVVNDVNEIKIEMKDHNKSDKEEFGKIKDKIDEVADAASTAASLVEAQEQIQTERHEENKSDLKDIKDGQAALKVTCDKLAADQQATKDRVTKIYTVATVVGAIGGSIGGVLVPLIINKFF